MEDIVQPSSATPRENTGFLSDISTKIILLLVFITPVLIIPNGAFPFQFTKTSIAVVLTIALLSIWVWNLLKNKEVTLFKSLLLYSLYAIPVAYLVSSIFSTQSARSFFGYQIETDTFGFMLLFAVLVTTLLVSLAKKTQVFKALIAVLVSAWVVLLFQLVQVLFGAPLPFAVLNDPIVNLVGRWNDFGVFVGLIASLTLFSLESFPLPKRGKYLVIGTLLVSVFFLTLVNLDEVWVLFGLASLTTLVIAFTKKQTSGDKKKFKLASVLAVLGVIISAFFLFFGGQTATVIQNTFNINALEVRPSFEGTLDVLSGVYGNNPIVGSGPNTFTTSWLLYRPDGVLQTPFWNTSFGSGSGTIPTAFVNGGIIVALAWIVFSLMLVYTIVRALFVSVDDGGKTYMLTALTAVGSLYLLVLHYIYSPSQSITLLFFVFVGLFLASIRGTSLIKQVQLSGVDSPRVGFGMTLAGVVLGLVMLGVLFDTGKTYLAVINQERAIVSANQGNLDQAEKFIESAIGLDAQDRFYRTASLIQITRLNQVIQSGGGEQEENQTRFQNALAGAIQYSGFAIQANPDRFENWFTRALVYATVVPLGIDGAYENALATLEEARVRNPKSPEVDLRFAEVYMANGNNELARSSIASALGKKADYTQAILLKAQIELNEGELDNAIESVRGAVFFEPRNAVLLYQLGILFLQDENYEDATSAFELAIQNQPDYANAAFFLAQAYSFLDRIEDALNLMNQLVTLNPDNEIVAEYRDVLDSGRNPFIRGEVETLEEVGVSVE